MRSLNRAARPAGVVRDAAGDYTPVWCAVAALCAGAALLCAAIRPRPGTGADPAAGSAAPARPPAAG